MNKLLYEGLEVLGLKVSEKQAGQLEIFLSELELFNPVYKLVSAKDSDEIIIRHFLDCLAGVPVIESHLKEGDTIADFGSGAGFPGVLLSIMLPEHKVYLVERMARRTAFLSNVLLRCNISSAQVVSSDVKEIDTRFDLITCRAFHPLGDIIGDVDRLLSEDGYVCAYKGRRDYTEAELEEVTGFTSELVSMRVPFLDEPRLMCVLRRCADVR